VRSRLLHIVVVSRIVATILAFAYFFVTISPAAMPLNRLFPINAQWWGCKYTGTTFRDITETAWIRNFMGTGVSSLTIVENVAGLLAYNTALRLAPTH